MGRYIKAARWIPPGLNPFIDPRGMLYDGMKAEFLGDRRDSMYVPPPIRCLPDQLHHRSNNDETVLQRNLRLKNIDAFDKFKSLLPGFSGTINAFEDHPDLIDEFVNILSSSSLI